MISLAPNYNNMTIAEVVAHRQQVLQKINTEVATLNRQFIENPMKLDTETINNLFENLKDINKTIETKKEQAIAPREKRCCRTCPLPGVKKVTWLTIGIEFATGVLLAAREVVNLVLTDKVNSQISDLEQACNMTAPTTEVAAMKGLSITSLVIIVLATGILVPLVSAIREIDNDNDKLELLLRVSELKEQGEEIRAFLQSFQEYKEKVHRDADASRKLQQQSFSQCVQCLDKLPDSDFKNRIPSRDHWISLMVQLLPDDHPIKIQLREMRDAALDQLERKKPKSSDSKKEQAKLVESSDEDNSSSSDSSPSPRRKFRGEKMPASRVARLERRNTPLLNDVVQATGNRFQQHYQARWRDLETQVGVRLDRIQLDNFGFDRDATLAPSIIQLGAPMPVVHDDSEEGMIEVVTM